MNIHWIQHVPFEGLGSIESWALRGGHRLSATRFHRRDSLPEMNDFDRLVIMGGPMNIYEEVIYPWLAAEKTFLRQAIDIGKPVIGICLGAQLVADALGARVYRNSWKEIGWFPVRKTCAAAESRVFTDFPREMEALHWHGDAFDVPTGCLHAAESAACRNQAFVFQDRIVGLQFHLEMTPRGAEEILDNCRNELVEGLYIQTAEEIISAPGRFAAANIAMDRLLDQVFSFQYPGDHD